MTRFKVLKSLRATIEDLVLDTVDYLTNKFNQSKNVFTAAYVLRLAL